MSSYGPQITVIDVTIPANGMSVINRTGQFFSCLSATDDFSVVFDDLAETRFFEGLKFEPLAPFNKVTVRNPHGQPLTAEFAIARGQVSDERKVISGTVNTVPQVANTLSDSAPVAVPGAAVAQILPDDPTRKGALLKNLSATESVWIKGTSTASANGFQLGPGDGLSLDTTAAAYAFCPGGAGAQISILLTGVAP